MMMMKVGDNDLDDDDDEGGEDDDDDEGVFLRIQLLWKLLCRSNWRSRIHPRPLSGPPVQPLP